MIWILLPAAFALALSAVCLHVAQRLNIDSRRRLEQCRKQTMKARAIMQDANATYDHASSAWLDVQDQIRKAKSDYQEGRWD